MPFDRETEKELEDLKAMREASKYQPPHCRLIKDATVEELVEFYKHITGKEPEPGRIIGIIRECKEVTPPFDIKEDLNRSVTEEEEASANYKARAIKAEETGDFQTSALYQHVGSEEVEHKIEFEKRKEELE